MWLPIIDVSEHQGDIDWEKMRDEGCAGVIVRVCHGQKIDDRFEQNWEDANQHFPGNVGVYPFINPKRGSPLQCATFLESCVRHKQVPFVMFDVENYKFESPNVGVIWSAAEFRVWLREHVAAVRRLLPDVVMIGYSNASFWNPNVNDPVLASQLEWIVPRYPIYSLNGYLLHPLPPPPGWPTWAFKVGPAGPFPPQGATWDGWQFSAGYNQQGPRYGCQSQDLDLNIVNDAAWKRWTQTATPPPEPPPSEEPMTPYIFQLAGSGGFGIRHESGSRPLNQGERDGPYEDETVWQVPAGSAWEHWITKELNQYYRELEPPVIDVVIPPVNVTVPHLNFSGTIKP